MKPLLAGALGSVALSLHLGAQQPTFRSSVRALKVSVRERGATVRHRRWVIVPKKP